MGFCSQGLIVCFSLALVLGSSQRQGVLSLAPFTLWYSSKKLCHMQTFCPRHCLGDRKSELRCLVDRGHAPFSVDEGQWPQFAAVCLAASRPACNTDVAITWKSGLLAHKLFAVSHPYLCSPQLIGTHCFHKVGFLKLNQSGTIKYSL